MQAGDAYGQLAFDGGDIDGGDFAILAGSSLEGTGGSVSLSAGPSFQSKYCF